MAYARRIASSAHNDGEPLVRTLDPWWNAMVEQRASGWSKTMLSESSAIRPAQLQEPSPTALVLDLSSELTWDDIPTLMDDLKRMARSLLRHEGKVQLNPTELVLTALRRQRRQGEVWHEMSWNDRHHLFGAVHLAMSQALRDHCRRAKAQKRCSFSHKLVALLKDQASLRSIVEAPDDAEPFEALLKALEQLKELHPTWADLVYLRFYCEMTMVDAARLLGVSERQARRWWQRARAMLLESLIRQGVCIPPTE
jgi:RNA polymerase sigma factor (sigma-70 family)